MKLLEIKNLSLYFKDTMTRALDRVSFDISENEIVGLVGESGSGKTMTGLSIMRILPKEAEISEGSIRFIGEDVLSLTEREMEGLRGERIGMVFQEPFTSLNPVLTAGCQITETLSVHLGLSKEEARSHALKLLEKVQIKDPERVFYSYPHQLSGGQRQRVMIAIAVSLKPKLLIADEPTTALDVTVQSEILKLLKDLKEEFEMSVLFITHDFAIINEMADRVIVMNEGRIVESGTKRNVLESPEHEYTKRLIAAVPKIKRELLLGGNGKEKDVLIDVKGLTKSFPVERGFLKKEISRIYAVKNVSIRIEKGKTLGLVGESGCGKSTLGRLLLGLEKPDSGEVNILNLPLLKMDNKRLSKMMQIVFQDPYSSLDPRMRIGDIILEGPVLLGMGRDGKAELLKDVLEKVHLHFNDRLKYPHQFSGGQRQRIAIARALAVNPEFIVLDEPVSSLDVLIQEDILSLLKELKDRLGLTYLFISHDLRVVEAISDNICVMYSGEIVEYGSKEDIYNNPKNPYTKKLVESIPQF